MQLNDLTQIIKDCGVVGCGGSGFPSHLKLNSTTNTIILNCAECEPLLHQDRYILEYFALEILSTLEVIRIACDAKEIVLAISESYDNTLKKVEKYLHSFSYTKISKIPDYYPNGDEYLLIYEITGKRVLPGQLTKDLGICVFNVETVLNIYYALDMNLTVSSKYVSILGDVKEPKCCKVPLGTPFSELVKLAGGATIDEYSIVNGGPMSGKVASVNGKVEKTTKAIIVLPKDCIVVNKLKKKPKTEIKRAMSVCSGCGRCTNFCSRHLLGYAVTPHLVMKQISSNRVLDTNSLVGSMLCSNCGLCNMYACINNLSPRTLTWVYGRSLVKQDVDKSILPLSEIVPNRKDKLISKNVLIEKLGLSNYDHEYTFIG